MKSWAAVESQLVKHTPIIFIYTEYGGFVWWTNFFSSYLLKN